MNAPKWTLVVAAVWAAGMSAAVIALLAQAYAPAPPPPTVRPSASPTARPSLRPTPWPTPPTPLPSTGPTPLPTSSPTAGPTPLPSTSPTGSPTLAPTPLPTSSPTRLPTGMPTFAPTVGPTFAPTLVPTGLPTVSPTRLPTPLPTGSPTIGPTRAPTDRPSARPSQSPTARPFTLRVECAGAQSLCALVRGAADRWRRVIAAGFDEPYTMSRGLAACGQPALAAAQTVTDALVVHARFEPMSGGTLGYAGPCLFFRDKPRMGSISMNSEAGLSAENMQRVIEHEIGHVLGLGTMWDDLASADAPPRYTGAGGRRGNAAVGGPAGGPVIEDTGGSGTAGGHWKETVYRNELMTGYLSGDAAMSRLSVAALADLGYRVREDGADWYLVGSPRLRGSMDAEIEVKEKRWPGEAVRLD